MRHPEKGSETPSFIDVTEKYRGQKAKCKDP